MDEQVATHEVRVALVMISGQTHILVQIQGLDLGKAKLSSLIVDDQLPVGSHGTTACGQAKHAVGLPGDLCSNDISGIVADICIVFRVNQSH